jgi:xanthine dehydrogenase molybdenum-binding subunit
VKVRLRVNGAQRELEARPGESLLDLLRLQLGITSPKRGCQPQGQCGSCVALVNGEPHATCTIAADNADGHEVITVEGLSEAERDRFARAFAATQGLQCGFCTPGIVIRASHLLDRNPAPTREEIARALGEHLCRCTGYVKIVEAVLAAAPRSSQPCASAPSS